MFRSLAHSACVHGRAAGEISDLHPNTNSGRFHRCSQTRWQPAPVTESHRQCGVRTGSLEFRRVLQPQTLGEAQSSRLAHVGWPHGSTNEQCLRATACHTRPPRLYRQSSEDTFSKGWEFSRTPLPVVSDCAGNARCATMRRQRRWRGARDSMVQGRAPAEPVNRGTNRRRGIPCRRA